MEAKGIMSELLKRNRIFLNIIIIILLNLVSLTLYFRIDLTSNNAYSLSQISKEVVSTLQKPLNIKVFFTEDLPAPYNSVYRYLKDILVEYSQSANKNFNYEFIDVEKDKDLASDFGIYPVQIREIKEDQLQFRNAYMGISIVHGDLIEKMESITDSSGLEYRITSLIKKMTGKIDTLLELKSPISITLYASSNLPIGGMEDLAQKVSDIVKNCNARNYNRLKFLSVDPYINKENDAKDIADTYGIIQLEWPAFQSIAGRGVKAGNGVIGIVVELDNRFESIQLLSKTIFGQYTIGSLNDLEERINSAIDNLININPKIGYISDHGEMPLGSENQFGRAGGAGSLYNLLSDMYEIVPINLAEEDIDEDLSTIIINGPKKEYSDYELLKIDQSVMDGKSMLFLIDSFQEIRGSGRENMFGGGRPMILPLNTGIEKLVSHYGVSVNKDIVMDKRCYRSLQRGYEGQNLYFVPMINESDLDDVNVITRFIKMLVMPRVSSLTIEEDKIKDQNIKKTVLVSSSEESWLMKGRISYMPFGVTPPEKSKMSKYNLATLLSGRFTSYFMDRAIPEEPKKKGDKKARKSPITSKAIIEKAVKSAKIIVVGSSEIASAGVLDKEGRSSNSVFLHNIIDYLSGNYNVPEMRSKGLEINPLEDTKEHSRLILKLINIAGLPLFVICIGLVIWRVNIAKKRKIGRMFGGVTDE